MLRLAAILCLFLWLHSITVLSFSIMLAEEEPIAFSPTKVFWTRADNDPTNWWLDEQTSDGGKVLSMQVDGTGGKNGSVQFVFVKTG
ncbi:hypothetical protein VKT23_015551 [Stygiomarasmius scandens]|uniref:Uncharacterized protein n=1 Tax=Marasmiellus scandens TaxID=2682957 RepID=A0ABR1J1T5_9AGAR